MTERTRIFAALLTGGFLLVPVLALAAEKTQRERLREKFQPKNIQFSGQQGAVGGAYEAQQSMLSPASTPPRSDAREVRNVQVPQMADEAFLAAGARAPKPVPIEYAIYETEYQADIEEEIAFVRERVKLEVFKKGGVTRIPLVNAGVGLKEVSLNQRPSMVNREGRQYVLLIDRPGKYSLDVQFFVKVSREREHGPGNFSFETLPSPISLLDVQIEEPEMDIFVEPSIKIVKESSAHRTLATVVLPYAEVLQVRWSQAAKKVELPSAKLEPRLYMESATLASVGEGVAQFSSHLRYSILQSEVSNFKVVLPKDVAILDVQGSDMRDWKVLTEQGNQLLDVYLTRGVKGAYELRLRYEKTVGDGSVISQLPELVAIGVERESGVVGIQARSNVEIAFSRLSDATEIDVKELPSELWDQAAYPILLAYKYLKHPYSVEIDIRKHGEVPVLVAAIDTAHYVTLVTDEGKMLTGATLQMRNNVKQFMRLELPPEARLLSCFVSGSPVKPAQDSQGWTLIPLEKSEALGATVAQFPVEVVYLTHGQPFKLFGSFAMQLPKLDIPVGQLYWSVFAPEEFNYWKLKGDVKRVVQHIPVGLFGRLAGREEQAAQTTQVAYQSRKDADQVGQKIFSELKAAKAKGALPIKIEIPTTGKGLRFAKLLVTDESPSLVTAYVRNLKGAAAILNWVVFFAVLVAGGALGRRMVQRDAALTVAHKATALFIAIAVLLCIWLAQLRLWLVSVALAMLGLYLFSLSWQRRKHGQQRVD